MPELLVSIAYDGYCNQCAEMYDQPPSLSGQVLPGRTSIGVVCSGCGMTKVSPEGDCLGHNHGPDLRWKREGAALVDMCVACGSVAEVPVRDLYGVPFCSAKCLLAYRRQRLNPIPAE